MKHAQHTPATPRGKHRGIPLQLTATLALASLMALNACQQDMPTDNGTLPEGRYPVLIKAVVPQTRVVDDGWTTTWEDGDTISVGQAGVPDKIGRYVLNQDGTVKRIIDTLYYDLTKEFIAIKAWYPATETYGTFIVDYAVDNPVSLMDAGTIVQDYFHPVTLEFRHKDSKLRVQIEGDTEGAVYKVEVDAISQSTFNPSDVVVSTLDSDTKRMRLHPKGNNVWEGYVGNGSQISCVYVNGEEVPLEETLKPKMGQMCTVTVNVSYFKQINLNDLGTNEVVHLTDEYPAYCITGTLPTGSNAQIRVDAPITLKLKDATLNTSSPSPIYVACEGTARIILEGENQIKSTSTGLYGAITLEGENTHLLLEGPGTLQATGYGYATIGTRYAKDGDEVACGNITVKNATLRLTADFNGTAIGIGILDGPNYARCGDITIANCDIKCESSYYSIISYIGINFTLEMWDMYGNSISLGDINIYLQEGQEKDDFESNLGSGVDLSVYSSDIHTYWHSYEEIPPELK